MITPVGKGFQELPCVGLSDSYIVCPHERSWLGCAHVQKCRLNWPLNCMKSVYEMGNILGSLCFLTAGFALLEVK